MPPPTVEQGAQSPVRGPAAEQTSAAAPDESLSARMVQFRKSAQEIDEMRAKGWLSEEQQKEMMDQLRRDKLGLFGSS